MLAVITNLGVANKFHFRLSEVKPINLLIFALKPYVLNKGVLTISRRTEVRWSPKFSVIGQFMQINFYSSKIFRKPDLVRKGAQLRAYTSIRTQNNFRRAIIAHLGQLQRTSFFSQKNFT